MSDELVTVATFSTVAEAQLAQERLNQEGIRSVTGDAMTAGLLPTMGTGLGSGIRLQVNGADALRARDILSPSESEGEPPLS